MRAVVETNRRELHAVRSNEAELADDDDDSQLDLANSEVDDVGVLNEAIGDRVRELLALRDKPMRWLCAQIAAVTGERELSVPGLIKWLDQPERVLPYRIFALEEVLELPAGSLSRTLGYVPAKTLPPADIASAIAYDERLSEPSKRALLAAYREMTRDVKTKTVKHRQRTP